MGLAVHFSFPAHGHINPTLPVVRELVGRGERVVYYATRPFEKAIRGTGAEFRAYSPRVRMPKRGPGPFAQISTTLETLLDFSCAVLEGHMAEVRSLGPSHILFDSFAPWGRMIGQLLGLPAIGSVPSILINSRIDARYGAGGAAGDPRLTPGWYAGFLAQCRSALGGYGRREPPAPPQLLQSYGDWNLVYTSRQFQPFADDFDADRFAFVGPCFGFRPEAPAFPFDQLDGRPLVLVALGTVYGNQPRFYRACLEALAAGPCQVVLATGDGMAADSLGPIPQNFLVQRWVPQLEILRRAAAFVTHGGMNSVQEALYHGVPLVLAPQAADQFWISARAAELGAGIVLESRAEAAAIRAGVAEVLTNAGYADSAARIGASLRAAGGAAKAARGIQEFMRRKAGASPRELACGA